MQLQAKINSLLEISKFLKNYLDEGGIQFPILSEKLTQAIENSKRKNSWFTEGFQRYALHYWAHHLNQTDLQNWLSNYQFSAQNKTIGLVLAGNIPMVGFHDVLCVILSGNHAQIKLSSKDAYLIPFILDFWKDICACVSFNYTEKLENFNAVIATGSNNTARYFEYYFKEKPHIIRQNRSSIAILEGTETEDELKGLAEDIFTYFGLGCRNVTQLFLPKNYDNQLLFKALYTYQDLAKHHKYYNSYEYYRAIYLLNKEPFWDNNFVLLKESNALFAPVATVNYIEYEDMQEVKDWMSKNEYEIQACIGHEKLVPKAVPFGHAQKPSLNSYADNVDVMKFIENLD